MCIYICKCMCIYMYAAETAATEDLSRDEMKVGIYDLLSLIISFLCVYMYIHMCMRVCLSLLKTYTSYQKSYHVLTCINIHLSLYILDVCLCMYTCSRELITESRVKYLSRHVNQDISLVYYS